MAQVFNWSKGVAEFAIVVVGVVVGLAADEWRQGFQERSKERGYLERLEADLILGRERVAAHAARYAEASAAAGELPQGYNQRFKSVTGVRPLDYVTGAATMTPKVRARLLELLRSNPEVLSDLRYFHAEIAGAQRFELSLDGIDELLRQLRQ